MSLPALFLALTYPFTKRFFPIPQFYLGLAFSFGIPMAFAAVGNSVPVEAWILFAANVLWTLAYDTVYAMADKEDDLKIGIKTSAVTFGRYDIAAVMLCHGGFTLLMAVLGAVIGAAWAYWTAIPIVLLLQYRQYAAIKAASGKSVLKRFGKQQNRLGVVCRYFAHTFSRNKAGQCRLKNRKLLWTAFLSVPKSVKICFETLCYVSPYRMRD